MRFSATIELGGKTATGIPVPEEVLERLDAGRRPAVVVTLGGHRYRSTVGSMGGRSMIPLSAEHRTSAGVAAGDQVDVDIELDAAPREVTVPEDLAEALAADPAAERSFSGLSYSQQRWHVLSVESAKTAATRERRIATSVAMLREGRKR